jgi:HEPN domain-containing protein
MDVGKQIACWRDGSLDDMGAAEVLLPHAKLRQALFFAYLALEKILEAHVTKATQAAPPRIHNLLRLAELAGLSLPPEHEGFLSRLDRFWIHGRYPDERMAQTTREDAERLLREAKDRQQWLMRQL